MTPKKLADVPTPLGTASVQLAPSFQSPATSLRHSLGFLGPYSIGESVTHDPASRRERGGQLSFQCVRTRSESSTVRRPVARQILVAGGDLLGHHVQWPRRRAARVGLGPRQSGALRIGVLQAREVLRRVEQPVGVVDAQPVHLARRAQLQGQGVRGLEHLLVLRAQRGKLVDVEKAAVVDLVGGDAPVREPVSLRLEQIVQPLAMLGAGG